MKTYILKHSYRNGENDFVGTLPELVKICSYALIAGNSWDASINTNPKTAKGLENALNRSASVRRCYFDSYSIKARK